MLDFSHLPSVDFGSLYCLNQLRRYTETTSIPINEEGDLLQLRVSDGTASLDSAELFSVVFFSPIGTIGLTVDIKCIDVLSDHFLPGWKDEDPEKLLKEWRVVYALEKVIEASQIEEAECYVIDVIKQSEFARNPSTLSVELEINGNLFAASASIVAGNPDELAKRFPDPKLDMTDIGTIAFKCEATALGPEVKYEDSNTLSVGDVLILPGSGRGAFPLVLSVAGQMDLIGMCDEKSNFTLMERGTDHD